MNAYTEPYKDLTKNAIDIAQDLKSLREEALAINYYNQRINTCTDESLKQIFIHNRDEEIEHASMLMGWLKLYDNGWEKQLKNFVTDAKVTDVQ
ncbi:MAG: hypothetical protein RR091_02980 [Cloacibacillus sp.]